MRNSLLSISLDYNREQFNKSLELFEKLFEPILNLEPYDKLGVSNDVPLINKDSYKFIDCSKFDFTLYLDKYKLYQSVSRWYYNQNRSIIFSKLDVIINEYIELINKVKAINFTYGYIYNDIIIKYSNFNDKLIEKLNILKQTYNNEEINNKILNYCERLQIKQEQSDKLPSIPEQDN